MINGQWFITVDVVVSRSVIDVTYSWQQTWYC